MEITTNNWLFIEPDTHIEIEEKEVLLYNTLNKSVATFSDKECYNLFKEMQKENNLRVITLDHSLLVRRNIIEMLQVIMNNYMGDFLTTEASHQKPVQLTPLLKIEEFLPDPRKIKNPVISNNISTFVDELSIFINNENPQSGDSFFNQAYKQYLTIKKDSGKYQELDIDMIKKCYNNFSKHNLGEINILGGNIFKHSNISEIITFFNTNQSVKNYYLYFKDFTLEQLDFIKLLDKNSTLHIVFNHVASEIEVIENIISKTVQTPSIEYNFFIHSDECFDEIQNLYTKFEFVNYRLLPYFNGGNIDFLKSNVSFSKERISELDLSMKDILIREKLNESFLGRLYIQTDGTVYSNLNFDQLGNIYDNSMLKMIFKEVNQVKSWSFLRKDVSPCSSCLYKNLCPPVSNLECYMKKFNFCIE